MTLIAMIISDMMPTRLSVNTAVFLLQGEYEEPCITLLALCRMQNSQAKLYVLQNYMFCILNLPYRLC